MLRDSIWNTFKKGKKPRRIANFANKPKSAKKSNHCHGCYTPLQNAQCRWVSETTSLIVSCDTTYPLYTAQGCNHRYPCICPLPTITSCTNPADSSSFLHTLFNVCILVTTPHYVLNSILSLISKRTNSLKKILLCGPFREDKNSTVVASSFQFSGVENV